jgi:hypothetical protein
VPATRKLGQFLNVGDVELGIAQRLGVQRLRLGANRFAQAVKVVGVHEFHGDAQLGQRVMKQIVGATVQRSGGDDLIACGSQGGEDQGFRRLSRRQRQSSEPAFECRDALLEHVGGWIHDSRVNVAELLQREQSRRVVGIVEHV